MKSRFKEKNQQQVKGNSIEGLLVSVLKFDWLRAENLISSAYETSVVNLARKNVCLLAGSEVAI